MYRPEQALSAAGWLALTVVALGCEATPSGGDSSAAGAPSGDSTSEGESGIEFGTDDTLDVVTWNIEEFPKNGQSTAATVLDILQGLNADIVALQEIADVESFKQMVDQVPGWRGYVDSEWYAGLAYIYRADTIAVQRHYEIYTTREFWRPFPRSPQVMEFRFRGRDFVMINNHFKCCGDGFIDRYEPWDEETRRMDATDLLKAYIDTHFAGRSVIVLGDFNDSLTDTISHNVFGSLLDDPDHYRFTDMGIAEGGSSGWSYPSYPSHLDHILISSGLFAGFERADSGVLSLPIDEVFFDGWREYEDAVSDHRPVGLRISVAE